MLPLFNHSQQTLASLEAGEVPRHGADEQMVADTLVRSVSAPPSLESAPYARLHREPAEPSAAVTGVPKPRPDLWRELLLASQLRTGALPRGFTWSEIWAQAHNPHAAAKTRATGLEALACFIIEQFRGSQTGGDIQRVPLAAMTSFLGVYEGELRRDILQTWIEKNVQQALRECGAAWCPTRDVDAVAAVVQAALHRDDAQLLAQLSLPTRYSMAQRSGWLVEALQTGTAFSDQTLRTVAGDLELAAWLQEKLCAEPMCTGSALNQDGMATGWRLLLKRTADLVRCPDARATRAIVLVRLMNDALAGRAVDRGALCALVSRREAGIDVLLRLLAAVDDHDVRISAMVVLLHAHLADPRVAEAALLLAVSPLSRTRFSSVLMRAQEAQPFNADLLAFVLRDRPDDVTLWTRVVAWHQGGGHTRSNEVHHALKVALIDFAYRMASSHPHELIARCAVLADVCPDVLPRVTALARVQVAELVIAGHSTAAGDAQAYALLRTASVTLSAVGSVEDRLRVATLFQRLDHDDDAWPIFDAAKGCDDPHLRASALCGYALCLPKDCDPERRDADLDSGVALWLEVHHRGTYASEDEYCRGPAGLAEVMELSRALPHAERLLVAALERVSECVGSHAPSDHRLSAVHAAINLQRSRVAAKMREALPASADRGEYNQRAVECALSALESHTAAALDPDFLRLAKEKVNTPAFMAPLNQKVAQGSLDALVGLIEILRFHRYDAFTPKKFVATLKLLPEGMSCLEDASVLAQRLVDLLIPPDGSALIPPGGVYLWPWLTTLYTTLESIWKEQPSVACGKALCAMVQAMVLAPSWIDDSIPPHECYESGMLISAAKVPSLCFALFDWHALPPGLDAQSIKNQLVVALRHMRKHFARLAILPDQVNVASWVGLQCEIAGQELHLIHEGAHVGAADLNGWPAPLAADPASCVRYLLGATDIRQKRQLLVSLMSRAHVPEVTHLDALFAIAKLLDDEPGTAASKATNYAEFAFIIDFAAAQADLFKVSHKLQAAALKMPWIRRKLEVSLPLPLGFVTGPVLWSTLELIRRRREKYIHTMLEFEHPAVLPGAEPPMHLRSALEYVRAQSLKTKIPLPVHVRGLIERFVHD